MKKIELGLKAKDKITGIKGIITARAEYLTGCDQYFLAPQNQKEGRWFDEGRLIILSKKPLFKKADVILKEVGADFRTDQAVGR